MRRILLLGCLLSLGCATAEKTDPLPEPVSFAPERATLSMDDLLRREEIAESREEIEQILGQYLRWPEADEDYETAQTGAARLLLLLGANFSKSTREQRKFYRETQKAAERAMAVVPAFRNGRDRGQSVPEAAATLPVQSFEPLFLWTTAVFYTFRDVASLPEQILFKGRLQEAKSVLDLMMEKDPTWQDGSLQFSLGIYYLSVPKILGGDRDKARSLMDEAVEMGTNRLLPRWGRAKYLAVRTGDKTLFLEDLNWVAAQDPGEMDGPLIWNNYFHDEAIELLEAVDSYFR